MLAMKPNSTKPRLRHSRSLFHLALGLRPDRNGGGLSEPSSNSWNSAPTGTSKAAAIASNTLIVMFSSPRSIRPTYERSMSASCATRSCESPSSTRSLRTFQPMSLRAFMMTRKGHTERLTIDGLTVPYSKTCNESTWKLPAPAHENFRNNP